MKIYAKFDNDGFPTGFWPEDVFPPGPRGGVNTSIPSGAIEITQEQWDELVNNPGTRRWDGTSVVVYEAPVTVLVPQFISPLQARKALREWGIGRTEIQNFLNSIEDPAEKEIAEDSWEYATLIDRDNPLIAQCAIFLGKTEEDLDQFFIDASNG